MTPDVNNMADVEQQETEIEKNASSQTDEDAMIKAAKDEILKVMNNAMSHNPQPPMDVPFDDSIEYVEPMQDPYNKAITYLENHNILQIFQQLTASIVYTKPEKPLEFMMQQVEKMKEEKEEEQKKEKERKQKS